MAVAVENNSTQSVATSVWTGSEFSNTISFNVPASSTMLVVMFMDLGSAPGTVEWDGSGGTALTERVAQDDGNASGAQLWDLKDPATGTRDLYLGDVSNQTWRVHIVALSDTDDTTARGGTATATGWSATCTLSPTTVDTDFLIGCSSMGNTPTPRLARARKSSGPRPHSARLRSVKSTKRALVVAASPSQPQFTN